MLSCFKLLIIPTSYVRVSRTNFRNKESHKGVLFNRLINRFIDPFLNSAVYPAKLKKDNRRTENNLTCTFFWIGQQRPFVPNALEYLLDKALFVIFGIYCITKISVPNAHVTFPSNFALSINPTSTSFHPPHEPPSSSCRVRRVPPRPAVPALPSTKTGNLGRIRVLPCAYKQHVVASECTEGPVRAHITGKRAQRCGWSDADSSAQLQVGAAERTSRARPCAPHLHTSWPMSCLGRCAVTDDVPPAFRYCSFSYRFSHGRPLRPDHHCLRILKSLGRLTTYFPIPLTWVPFPWPWLPIKWS